MSAERSTPIIPPAEHVELLRRDLSDVFAEIRDLLNEIDCRIEHGAESGGHLEYVRGRLKDIVG